MESLLRINRPGRSIPESVTIAVVLSALLLGLPDNSSAHHGTAINYDWDITVPLEGVVTEFIWRNPHAALFLDVTEDDGSVVNYAIELTSPVMMARSSCGWTRNTFKAGDLVLFPVHPSRTNQPVVAGLGQCEEVLVNGVSTKK